MHPFTSVPVIVYVVVDDGFAVTVEPVVALNPVAGLHVYVDAPLALRVAVCCPTQIGGGVGTITTGRGFTVTVTCVDAVHPFISVPVIVYVVVEVGFAVTDEPVVALNPVAGLHVYVDAPLAFSVVVCCPIQIAGGVGTITIGRGFTVTVTCADAVHPFEVPVTVYVVVIEGFAVTEEPVELLRLVDGLQEYVVAPLTVKTVD